MSCWLFLRNTPEITAGTLQALLFSFPLVTSGHVLAGLCWEGEGMVLGGSPQCPAK